MRRGILSLVLFVSVVLLSGLASADPLLEGAPPPSAPAAAVVPDAPPSLATEGITVPVPVPIEAPLPAAEVVPPVPAAVSDSVVEPPPDSTSGAVAVVGEVVEGVGTLVDAYRTGGWLGALAVLVALLTAWSRRLGWLDEIPKRLRVLVPLLLGCIGACLVALAAGVGWLEAVCLALLTGPSAVALHQGIARSLLGLDSPETAQLKQQAGQ
jgi:hypothetical protein